MSPLSLFWFRYTYLYQFTYLSFYILHPLKSTLSSCLANEFSPLYRNLYFTFTVLVYRNLYFTFTALVLRNLYWRARNWSRQNGSPARTVWRARHLHDAKYKAISGPAQSHEPRKSYLVSLFE